MVYFRCILVHLVSFNLFWCISFRKAQHMDLQKISLYATRMPPTQFIFSGEIRSATNFRDALLSLLQGAEPLGPRAGGEPLGDPRGPKGAFGALGWGWWWGPQNPQLPRNLPPSWVGAQMSPGRGFYPRTPSSPPKSSPKLGWRPKCPLEEGGFTPEPPAPPEIFPQVGLGAQNVPWKRGFTPEPAAPHPKSSPKLGWHPKCPLEEGGAGGSGVKPPSRGHFGRQPNLGEDFGGS